MAIVVQRKPHVEVTDEETGWTMKGGRSFIDRTTTKLLWHPNGASCTVMLGPILHDAAPGASVTVNGLLYLNPGEERGPTTVRKYPRSGDFVTIPELNEIVIRLCKAWHEATYTTVTPMRVVIGY